MLAAKRLAGVAPEVNLGEHLKCTPPPSATLALKPRGDVTRSPKTGVLVAQQTELMPSNFFFKKGFMNWRTNIRHNFLTASTFLIHAK